MLLLDRVTDPHNVGAVLRSAEVFGARAVVAPQRHSAPETGALAKAASGALERLAYLRVPNLAGAMGSLREMGYAIVGLDGAADTELGAGGRRVRGPSAGAGAGGRGAGAARADDEAVRPDGPDPGGGASSARSTCRTRRPWRSTRRPARARQAAEMAFTFPSTAFPGAPRAPHIRREADGLELPCFISLSLVPTVRPELFRALFCGDAAMIHRHDDGELRAVFARTRTIAVVGVSKNQIRPSYYVARYLTLKGFRVIPVNPAYAGETLLGERVWPDLASLPAELGEIHMVDIFRRSQEAGAVVDAALGHLIGRGLRTIWMQIGVVDEAAAARAEAVGVTVVMDRCPKIEFQRLHGELRMGGFATGMISSRRG